MERIVAYCGVVCSECDAYVATRANDLDALERVAQRAREEFGVEDATALTAMCDGCLDDDGRQIGYCATCEIRACALARGLGGPPPLNCAYCDDYACETLARFLAHEPEARTVLEVIRASL
jgi:hypothetical protein